MYINTTADLDNKIVIITGSNTGIGKATALELAKRKAKIYFACRSETKAREAIDEIKNLTKNENLHFLQLDLTSLESVREFARKFRELESRLHVLINNAGVLSPLNTTLDGFEINMGVNHLAHFLLTNLLLDLLRASAPSRIVVVSSKLHMIGTIDRENFATVKAFQGSWKSYGNSKLANNLFMRELSRKLEGTGVTCNSLCPGTVNTEATRYLNSAMRFLMRPIMNLFYATPEKGAQTSIFLAVEPSIENETGGYYVGCKKQAPSRSVLDEDAARWLWEKSAELTGLKI
jgi:retinol dehydrogenase 12